MNCKWNVSVKKYFSLSNYPSLSSCFEKVYAFFPLHIFSVGKLEEPNYDNLYSPNKVFLLFSFLKHKNWVTRTDYPLVNAY